MVPAPFATMSDSSFSVSGGVAAVLVLGVAAAGGYYWLSHREAPVAPAPVPAVTVPAAPGPVAPVRAEVPSQPPQPTTPAKPTATLRYAGGQTAKALNGVTQDVRLDWEGPWSPIAKTIVEQGWE